MTELALKVAWENSWHYAMTPLVFRDTRPEKRAQKRIVLPFKGL